MICYAIVRPVIGSDLLIDIAGPELFLLKLLLLLNLSLFIDSI